MKSNLVFLHFLLIVLIVFNSVKTCAGNVKKSVQDENRDDNGESNDDVQDGSLDIAEPTDQNNTTVCTRRQNNQMHEVRVAGHKQFPFMASVMSQQNEHLCSGSVVSNGLILTTAKCTQMAISYVLLNATKAKRDETTVALHIIKTEKFPTFTGAESDKDVGLIYTEKHNGSIAAKVKLSNFTNPRSLVDMEVIGFGLNADVGQTKEMQYIGIENRVAPMHFTDTKDILNGYIDCIDTKVLTCFKDTGGPSIFDNELVGVVISGDDKCFKEMTSVFAVNKKVVDILPTYTFKAWLDEKIKKNEEQDLSALATYPSKPMSRRQMGEESLNKGNSPTSLHIVSIFCLNILFLWLCY